MAETVKFPCLSCHPTAFLDADRISAVAMAVLAFLILLSALHFRHHDSHLDRCGEVLGGDLGPLM